MNLLPSSEQTQVHREYYARLFSVLFFGAAAVCVVGIVSLLPAYVSLLSQKESAEAEIKILQSVLGAQDNFSEVEFATAKKEITLLSAGKGEQNATSDIALALRKREETPGVRILGVSYEKRGTEEMISLNGEADSRSSLRAFQKALEGEYRFGKISIPVSNFVKERNIPFTITIVLRGVAQDVATTPQ